MVLAVAASLAMLAGSSAAQQQWTPDGVPICTLPDCGGNQARICPDGSSGAIVVFQGGTISFGDIMANRVNGSGQRPAGWPVGGVPIDNFEPSTQIAHDICSDGQGGMFIFWADGRNASTGNSADLFAQHILSNGQVASGWEVGGMPICTAPGAQAYPRAIPDGEGGVFVVWGDGRNGAENGSVFALRMLGSGERHTGWLENGFPIRTGAGNVGLPCLVTDGQGGIIVGWSDTRQPLPGTYALRLSGDGQIAAGWTPNGNLVATKSPFPPGVFEMASDGAGGAYFALMAATDPQGFEDIYASRINGDGQRPPGWPLSGVPVSTLPLTQSWLTACEDGVGGVYLAWGDFGYDVGVKMQHLLADGMRAPGWGELGIAPVDHFDFQTPRGLVPDGAGGVFVLVQVSSGPYYDYLQHLTGAGTPVSGWPGTGVILTTAGSPYDGQITPDGAGGVIAVWNDSRNGFQYQLYAQRFKGGVITSVQLSLVSAEAEPNRVRLTWQGTGAANLAARVERRDEIGTWLPLGVPTSDGSDRLRFEDASVSPGTRYAYRLGYVEDGAERFTEETWVEVPRAFELALDGFRPNPAAGVPTISFTLASASVARLEVLDVAGRRVAERDLISFGPGRHSIRLDSAAALCPGVYLVRLAQGDRVLRARGIVSR